MIEEFLKDKKKTGILVILVIVIIASGILYCSSGFRELKKNDTESIFIEDERESIDNNYDEDYEMNKSLECTESKNSYGSATASKSKVNEKSITVEIKGEVKKPDVYILKENSIIKDLIEEAGGLTENADISNINRAKQLQNHELVYISNKNEEASIQTGKNQVQSSASATQSNSMININSATADELKSLNGIGDSKANSIIEYREKNGGFKSIDDIKNVDGIGEKMFEKIKDSLTV